MRSGASAGGIVNPDSVMMSGGSSQVQVGDQQADSQGRELLHVFRSGDVVRRCWSDPDQARLSVLVVTDGMIQHCSRSGEV